MITTRKNLQLPKDPLVFEDLWNITNLEPLIGSIWYPEDAQTINSIISGIEHEYDCKIPRASSGAPWLCRDEHMPSNWSWQHTWSNYASRASRMRDDCNRHWATVDSARSLLLEHCVQFAENQGKDEFFGLKMTTFNGHSLCVSIAHKQHGQQMRTELTTLKSTSLHGGQYDVTKRHILFETQQGPPARFLAQ